VYTIPGSSAVVPGLTGDLLRNALVLEAEYKHPVLANVPCRAYAGGRRWLLWQAVAGYGLFTGEEPDAEKMSAVL
jgi:shikimate 5-dehydrogenase